MMSSNLSPVPCWVQITRSTALRVVLYITTGANITYLWAKIWIFFYVGESLAMITFFKTCSFKWFLFASFCVVPRINFWSRGIDIIYNRLNMGSTSPVSPRIFGSMYRHLRIYWSCKIRYFHSVLTHRVTTLRISKTRLHQIIWK
jgi:hypothetical protein